jgi:hypothetical protein
MNRPGCLPVRAARGGGFAGIPVTRAGDIHDPHLTACRWSYGSLADVADSPWIIRRATSDDGSFLRGGIGRASLSAERKNFARAAYLSEGYLVVDSGDAQSDTMMKDLAAG